MNLFASWDHQDVENNTIEYYRRIGQVYIRDLVIDNKSTKQFTDRDWDTYRNHRVGFVFQNYNLIPHQTVLSNVELALPLRCFKTGKKEKSC